MAGKVTNQQVSAATFNVDEFRKAVNYVNPKNKGYVRFVPNGKGGVKLEKVNNKLDIFLGLRTNIDADKNKAMRVKFTESLTRELKWADKTKVEKLAASITHVTKGEKKGEIRTDALSRKELQTAFKEYDRLMNSTGGRQKMIDNLLKATAERCGLVATEDAVKELKSRFFPSHEDWKVLVEMQDRNPDIDVGQPGHMKMDEMTFKAKFHALELKCEDAVKRAKIENLMKSAAGIAIDSNAPANDFGLHLSIDDKAQLRGALLHFLNEKELVPQNEDGGIIGTGGMVFEAFIDKVLPELYKKSVSDVRNGGDNADRQLAMDANFSFDAIMEEAEKFMIGARDYINKPPADAAKSTGDGKFDAIIKDAQNLVNANREMAKQGYINLGIKDIDDSTNISAKDRAELYRNANGAKAGFNAEGLLRTFTAKFLAERGIGEDVKPEDEVGAVLSNTTDAILETLNNVKIAAKMEYGSAKKDAATGKKEAVDSGMGDYVKDMEDAIGEIASGAKGGFDKDLMGKLFSCTLANITNRKIELITHGAATSLKIDKGSEEADKKFLKATAEAYVSFEKNVLKTISGAKTAFEKVAKAAKKKGLIGEEMFNDMLQRASTKFANAHKAALHEFFLKSPVEDAEEGAKMLNRIFKAKISEANAELNNDLAVASLGRTIGAANNRKLQAVEERVAEALAQKGMDGIKLGRPGIIDEKTARANLASGALKRLYTATLAAHLKDIKTVDGHRQLTDENVGNIISDFNAKALKLVKSAAESEAKFIAECEKILKEQIANNIENEGGAFKGYVTGEFPATADEKKQLVKDLTAEVMRFKHSDIRKAVNEIIDSPESFEKKDVKLIAKNTIDDFKTGGAERTINGLVTIVNERIQMVNDFLKSEAPKNVASRLSTTAMFGKGGALENASALEKGVFIDNALAKVKNRMKALPTVYATGDKGALETRMVNEAVKLAEKPVKAWTKFRTSFLAKAEGIEKEFGALGDKNISNCRNWVLHELAQKFLKDGADKVDMDTALGYLRKQLNDEVNYAVGKAREKFDEYVAKIDKVLKPVMEKTRKAAEGILDTVFGSLTEEGCAHLKDVVLPKIFKEIEYSIYRDPDKFMPATVTDLRTGKSTTDYGLVIDDIKDKYFHPLKAILKENLVNSDVRLKALIRVAGAGVLLNDKVETAAALSDLKTWLASPEGHAKLVAAEKALLDHFAEVGSSEYDENDIKAYGAMTPGNAVAEFRFAARDILKMHTAQMLYAPFDNERVAEAKEAFERWVDSHGLSRFEDFSKTSAKDRIMQKFFERIKSLQDGALEHAENEPILTPAFIELIDQIIDADGTAMMIGEWKTNALKALEDRYLKANDDSGYIFDPNHPRSVAAGEVAQEVAARNREMILSLLGSRISAIAGEIDSADGIDKVRDAIAKIKIEDIINSVNNEVNECVEKCVRRYNVEEEGREQYARYAHSIERQLVKDAVGEELAAKFPNGLNDLLTSPTVGQDPETAKLVGTVKAAIASYLNEALQYCRDNDLARQYVRVSYKGFAEACVKAIEDSKEIWMSGIFRKSGLAIALQNAAKEM